MFIVWTFLSVCGKVLNLLRFWQGLVTCKMTRSKGCLPGRYVIVKFFHADGSASKVPKHNIYVDTQINSSIHHGKSWPLG